MFEAVSSGYGKASMRFVPSTSVVTCLVLRSLGRFATTPTLAIREGNQMRVFSIPRRLGIARNRGSSQILWPNRHPHRELAPHQH